MRNTETLAFKNPDPAYSGTDEYLVSGFKWFTSATDSEMTLLLAKINSHSAPLSLFFAETKDPSTPSGLQAGIKVQRLKNKYGTKALPTAELELTAIKAKLIGQPGRGVATISALLNITRIHTAVNSVAFLRRALAINHSFAGKRKAFGKLIKDQPLHAQTLLELETTWKACMLFTFHVVSLLGRSEYLSRSTAVGKREDKRVEGLLRMLTLVVKAWVSKECNAGLSEAMEAMGGQGYMEEVDIGRLLRDCQVNCIWEGTTNILSLDLRKVVLSNPKLYVGLLLDCIKSPLAIESSSATFCCETHILAEADRLLGNETTLTVWLSNEANARKFLYQIGQLVSASLMISHFRYFDGGSGCGEEGGGGLSRDSIHYWCCLSGRFTSTHNARL